MAFRSYRRLSAKAVWSRKVIFIVLQLLLLTIFLHRFMNLHTPAALAIMGVCFIAAAGALLVSLWALKQIWDKGYAGAGRALASIVLASLMLAGPIYFLPKYITLPQINDITTDFSAPPNFEALAQRRSVWANSIIYPGDAFAQQQKNAYPHIKPMILERSAREAYDLVRDAVRRLDWRVVEKQKPGKDGASGWIEATDKTLIMGFVDDVVVRVSGDDAGARIDVRSASRFGRHDFGGNANRISQLFEEIRTTLAKGEQQLKLQKEIAARRALKLKEAEKRRKRKAAELARKKREERALAQEQRFYSSDAPPPNQEQIKKVKKKKRRKKRKIRPISNSEWNNLFGDR